ncbi:UDP-N-acetylmuramate--L-alanine ligase [Putridiphycobacter roseus]|uniref:UDP-N-acetylmuramate--L-alanine ligase n=1 Tax=Putridiphycobacter roseus TaxID=2219161 RepID=A0A2W1NGE5_9FLAO|nr:UDP-N-acetylmuramate--L-alanine ligase [Putridiphycobacter roseus]PZE18565.1 UDP-N-acetylmuramate--L-alanine ligase [Putridiphycobacter roseus]
MKLTNIHSIYFIGIGGIGMSALARYFNANNKEVMGYDKTDTKLTRALASEGIAIHYNDRGLKALEGLEIESTLVVYTPAVSEGFEELLAFKNAGFNVVKRAKALGLLSKNQETFAVAGTHGKTTTSSIMAHVLYETEASCNAFIGGITTNYNSNFLVSPSAKRVVVEADEFDRSFLELSPNYSIITSMDADHLDIYGDASALEKSFIDFANLNNEKGIIMVQDSLDFKAYTGGAKILTYGLDAYEADWFARNIRYENGRTYFDIHTKNTRFISIEFGLPGRHNVENALAVFALLYEYGVAESTLRNSFKTYLGVKRRFEFHLQTEKMIIIDDYAHHPSEITAFLNSVRSIYEYKNITCVFQPHLFSRTQDFMDEFAVALSLADKVYLLDIYPAREMPIPGVTSEVLLEKIKGRYKYYSSKATIVEDLKKSKQELIVIVGAGDIDSCIEPIVAAYTPKGNE